VKTDDGRPATIDHELLAAARRTSLIQSGVIDFAECHPLERILAASTHALASAGAEAALVLAVAASHRGVPLDPEVVRGLLPEVDDDALVGPLVYAAGGDRVELLIRFLEDGAGTWEREALALLLAADLLDGQPAPKRLLTAARRLARRSLSIMAGLRLGAGAARLADPHLDTLAGHYIAVARTGEAAIRSILEVSRRRPLEVLPTVPPPRITSGYTVRNEACSVGRNDPCPCGSGKKYKKCCADKLQETAAPERPPIDPRLLTWEQVSELHPSAVAALDPRRLSRRARIEALRRLMAYRRWAAAERVLEAMHESEGAGEAENWRFELIDVAMGARAHDVVERHVAALPPDRWGRRLRILMDCVRRPPDLIDRLHAHALAALEADDDVAALDIAFAMLDYFPALGVFVARGSLSTDRRLDSHTLLEALEEARDELGIGPFEPWWDVWEQISSDDAAFAGHGAQQKAAEVATITGELRRARENAEEATVEAARLQRRLKELEAASTATNVETEPAPPSVSTAVSRTEAIGFVPAEDLEREKERLRAKVEELQRIISQGQMERRELRQRLAASAKEGPSPSGSSAAVAKVHEGGDADGEPADVEAVHRPRRVLVPQFSPRASKALAALPPEVVEQVIVLAAELSSGRENTWAGVKRLRVRQVLSARAGIHYRLLFSVGDGTLDVEHVTHRRDLEQAIASLS
jgi:SEC-C motif